MAAGTGRATSYRSRVRAKIAPFSPADLDDVVAFRGQTFGPAASITKPQYVRWMYDRPLDDGEPSLWLFRSDGVVEGFQGVIRTSLHVDGRDIDAAWAAELFVSPQYQLRGVGAVLSDLAIEAAPLTLAFEVTDSAKRAFVRSGWSDLGEVTLFARPVDVAAFSEARGRSLPGVVTSAVGLALRGYEAATGAVNRVSRLRLVDIDRFDARADALWTAVASQYKVIARRDAATLNWRFLDDPRADQYRRCYLQRGDEVVGYAVLRLGRHGGVEAGWIVDFLCAPRHARALLAECTRRLRREGVQAVYCIQQPGRLARAFTINGFSRRSTGWPLMVRALEVSEDVADAVLDRHAWYLTGFDSNVDRPRDGIVYAT